MEDQKKLPELLTVDEIAAILKVKPATIYYYKKEGMPCFSQKPLLFLELESRIWISER